MPSSPSALLGAFSIDAQWPITVTPPARVVTVSSNALSTAPVQVNDFVADFGVIQITAIVRGVETQGETAADHLARQIANLCTEVAKDTNDLVVQWGNATTSTTYHIKKSSPPTIVYDVPYGRANVAFVTIELNYLP